jgi:hypothetical protein
MSLSPYAQFETALEAVPERSRATVRELRAQAVSYVWGWQDASTDAEHETDVSIAFGYAYGIVAARFAAGAHWSRPPIHDAWASWRKFGDIRDYSGRVLNAVETPGGAA